MSPGTYLGVLAFGAAAVALWVHLRFPDLAPKTFTGALVSAGAALVGWNLCGRLAVQALEAPSRPTLVVALIGLVFAPLAAVFLTMIWIMRAVASMGPGIR